ncbi:type II toxin-antitoxin system Phd/YefM family antitoxin [Geodermatophilus sp. SYSU D00758]
METIDLRELNQNPSRAVARVRAGVTVLVTDRGRTILRMVREVKRPGPLHNLVAAGEATAPIDHGMPELIPDLAPERASLADLVMADRRREPSR